MNVSSADRLNLIEEMHSRGVSKKLLKKSILIHTGVFDTAKLEEELDLKEVGVIVIQDLDKIVPAYAKNLSKLTQEDITTVRNIYDFCKKYEIHILTVIIG